MGLRTSWDKRQSHHQLPESKLWERKRERDLLGRVQGEVTGKGGLDAGLEQAAAGR